MWRASVHVQGAVPLSRQLDYFRDYQSRVSASAGGQRAAALTSGSIFLVSAGTSDYLQNYYVNPVLGASYTPDQFSDALMQPFTAFVEVIKHRHYLSFVAASKTRPRTETN